MSVCIFLGPTLPVAEATALLEGSYLPPARLGDVYRAVSLLEPRAVGIVDGYFQWAPAVWHKEILWAIERGIHVFGAASMGALRAAELAPLGMCGVGLIFEAYRDGQLEDSDDVPFEDDDEVAVVHGPPESGYLGLSEAMVNIRCTLAAARRDGVIGEATRRSLTGIAKEIFFPGRTYPAVLRCAREERLPEPELASLELWLPSGRVDQKRIDATAMLAAIRDFIAADPPPARAQFTFERTTLWERAEAALRPPVAHDPEAADVLAELRVDARRFEGFREAAWRALIDEESPDGGSVTAGAASIARAAHRDATRRLRELTPTALIERKLLSLLRETGAFEPLRARAEAKHAAIATQRSLPEIDEFSELQLLELRDWYFTRVVESEMPDDLDQWTRQHGHASLTEFHRSILAEYVFRDLVREEAAE